MSGATKRNEDPGLAPAAVLKELVAVTEKLQTLERTIGELRKRIEIAGVNQGARVAALAATLDASVFIGSLVKLHIAIECEEPEYCRACDQGEPCRRHANGA